MTNVDVSFYVDCMIVEALADKGLTKTAEGGLISSLIQKVQEYVMAHVDPNNKVESVLSIIGPGVFAITMRAMGLGWIGALLSFAMKMFGIEIGPILTSIWGMLKSAISGDKQVTSSQIDSAVSGAVQEHVKPATPAEAQQLLEKNDAQNLESRNYQKLMRDVKLVKLALIDYERQSLSLTKEGKGVLDFLPGFNSRKSSTATILQKVLSWIFKVTLASAGLMVLTDGFKKVLKMPNALDGTLKNNKPVAAPSAQVSSAKQTKFPLNPSYINATLNSDGASWQIPIRNTPTDIENLLIEFAKEVYQGLDGLEGTIRASTPFQLVKNKVIQQNIEAQGDNMVFIPKVFTNKKQLVDLFIDDVAQKAP